MRRDQSFTFYVCMKIIRNLIFRFFPSGSEPYPPN